LERGFRKFEKFSKWVFFYSIVANAIKAIQSTPAKDKAPIVFMIFTPVF